MPFNEPLGTLRLLPFLAPAHTKLGESHNPNQPESSGRSSAPRNECFCPPEARNGWQLPKFVSLRLQLFAFSRLASGTACACQAYIAEPTKQLDDSMAESTRQSTPSVQHYPLPWIPLPENRAVNSSSIGLILVKNFQVASADLLRNCGYVHPGEKLAVWRYGDRPGTTSTHQT